MSGTPTWVDRLGNGWPLQVLVGCAIAVAYPWQPLYSGNQHVYLVHALAQSAMPGLQLDPIYAQPDPFVLFTWLSILFIKVWPGLLHLGYFTLNVVYVNALYRIVNQVDKSKIEGSKSYLFYGLLLLTHSSQLWGSLLQLTIGLDLRWVFDSGMAEQGLLRGYWQPSVFGVFLLTGLAFYLEAKWLFAMMALAVAGAFHANYILLGGVLATAMVLRSTVPTPALVRARAFGLFLLLVMPCVAYILLHFGTNSAEVSAAVASLGQNHPHFDPITWLNSKTLVQLCVVLAAFWLFRNQPFMRWMGAISMVFVMLSLIAICTPGSSLYSLSPWRFSVVLMPICTALLLLKLLNYPLMLRAAIAFGITGTASIGLFRVFGSAEITSVWTAATGAALLILCTVSYTTRNNWSNWPGLSALVICSIFSGAIGHWAEKQNIRQGEPFQLAQMVAGTSVNFTVMVPPHFTAFRLNSGHPVLIDANLHHDASLPHRLKVLRYVDRLYHSPVFNLQEMTQYPEVKLVVIDKKKMPAVLNDWHPLGSTASYTLLGRSE